MRKATISFRSSAPGFIARGKGCHAWDLDGNEFIEYGMGLRAVTLGHGFESVVEAAYQQMRLGINFTRPAKIEVDLAETMLEIIDGADMVKFAKNGSDVTTAAVKLARAYTGQGPGCHLWRPTVLLHRRLVYRHHGDECWHSSSRHRHDVEVSLQRPRELASTIRPVSRTDCLRLDGGGGCNSA